MRLLFSVLLLIGFSSTALAVRCGKTNRGIYFCKVKTLKSNKRSAVRALQNHVMRICRKQKGNRISRSKLHVSQRKSGKKSAIFKVSHSCN